MKFVVENCKSLDRTYGREGAIRHFHRSTSQCCKDYELDDAMSVTQGSRDEHVKRRIDVVVDAVDVNDSNRSNIDSWPLDWWRVD